MTVPGRYDGNLGLRVLDTENGPVPVVSARGATLSAVTKTDHKLERDDDGVFLSSMTKTEAPREQDDSDIEPTMTAATDLQSDDRLLALLTKTLHMRESDDEGRA